VVLVKRTLEATSKTSPIISGEARLMDQILTQFSFIIGGVVILGLAVAFIARRSFTFVRGILLGVLVVLLVAAWIVLHPAGNLNASAEQVRSQIGSGTPVLLEFLSQY
jgi:hypothetical protein